MWINDTFSTMVIGLHISDLGLLIIFGALANYLRPLGENHLARVKSTAVTQTDLRRERNVKNDDDDDANEKSTQNRSQIVEL